MTENINIFDELKLLNSEILITAERGNFYFLPENFFADFSDNVNREIWLNSVSRKNLYSVPADYFKNLPDVMIDKVSISSSVLKGKPYYVPDGYFKNFSNTILQKINRKQDNVQQELEEISPLLSKIPKTNVFSIPSEYFDTLAPAKQIKTEKPAKVISISPKFRNWITYAAAACVAGFLFIGGHLFYPGKKINQPRIENSIANVNVQNAISKLSDDEIDNYLKNDNSDIGTNNSSSDNQSMDVRTLLENTSDEEIHNYLLDNADPAEKTSGI